VDIFESKIPGAPVIVRIIFGCVDVACITPKLGAVSTNGLNSGIVEQNLEVQTHGL